jgi:hypothetical protein
MGVPHADGPISRCPVAGPPPHCGGAIRALASPAESQHLHDWHVRRAVRVARTVEGENSESGSTGLERSYDDHVDKKQAV